MQRLSRGLLVGICLFAATTGLSSAETLLERAIREGVSRDGSQLKPPMAFWIYRNIGAEDMKALIAFLRTLKPVPFGGK